MRNRWALMALTLLLMLVTACGGNGDTAADAPTSDADQATEAEGGATQEEATEASPEAGAGEATEEPTALEPLALDLYTCCVSGTEIMLWVALDNGLFEEHGLDVNYTIIPPPTGLQALTTGEVQIGKDTPGGAVNFTGSGVEGLTLIAGALSQPVYRLMTGSEEITSPEDLVGRQIAVSGKYSSPAVAVMDYMKQELDADLGEDYETVPFRTISEILPALQEGVVEVGVLSTPLHLQGEAVGLREVVNLSESFPQGNSWVTTTRSFADENPEVVTRFLRAYVEAIALTKEDRDTAIDSILAHVEGITPEAAEVTYDEYVPLMSLDMPVEAIEPFTVYTDNPGAADVDLESLIDYSYLEELEAEGFLEEHGLSINPAP